MTGLYKRKTVPLDVRGLSRSDHEEILTQQHSPRDYEPSQYYEQQYAPIKSVGVPEFSNAYGDHASSPNTDATTSILSVSNGWTTGNTTERSSIYSLCEDEFDRKASKEVRRMFEEIDFMLFERMQLKPEQLYIECRDWVQQFPHLRVRGFQALAHQELGFQYVEQSPRPGTASNMLVDVTEQDISDAHTANELAIMGRHMDAMKPQISDTALILLPGSQDSQEASMREEIIVEDGIVEDVIAVDYKSLEDDRSERTGSSTIYRRHRSGIPPVSPQACVKDNIIDAVHDFIWAEVVSWMRNVTKAYSLDIISNQGRSISVAPPEVSHFHTGILRGPPSREYSNLSLGTARTEKRLTSTSSDQTGDNIMDGVLSISSKALQLREKSNLGEGSDLMLGRPPSSFARSTQHNRPPSVSVDNFSRTLSARLKPLRQRLAPIERAKTPTAVGDDRQHKMSKEVIIGQRIPQYRNGTLPPLEAMEHSKGLRAMSAVHDKESRLPGYRDQDKYHMIEPRPETRPNTTHSHYRSETPSASRQRSMTPVGRITHIVNLAQSGPAPSNPTSHHRHLNITGSGISTLAEGGSPEHDLEDTLEDTIHYSPGMPLRKPKNVYQLGPVR